MTLRTLNYGNYGIFLIMGHAGFCPSTVGCIFQQPYSDALFLYDWALIRKSSLSGLPGSYRRLTLFGDDIEGVVRGFLGA